MTPLEVVEIGNDAIFTMLKVMLPVMLVALGVGLSISLVQALTQMQEVTLAFVPKIIAVFVTLALALPFMLQVLLDFANRQFDRMIGL